MAAFQVAWEDSNKTARCCTSAVYPNFRLYLAGAPRCAWNRSAAIVLADHIIEKDHADKTDWQLHRRIQKKILVHMKTLCKKYAALSKSQEQRLEARKTSGRNTRRHTVGTYYSRPGLCTNSYSQLFHQRRELTTAQPLLRKHKAMLESLGPDGMSSDEEISVPGTMAIRYQIRPLPFRSAEVTTWLRKMDWIYLMLRHADAPLQRRGNKPRERVLMSFPENHIGTHRFVSDLPLNTYDHSWLEMKGQAFMNLHVRPQSVKYDFSMGDIMEQYVSCTTLLCASLILPFSYTVALMPNHL